MCFATIQHPLTPGNTKDFEALLKGRVLGLNIEYGLSLFILVLPANFDSMGHDHKSMALNLYFASNDSRPCCVLLK